METPPIVVKISYPKKQIEKNKIIIWSMPPNEDTFFPDSTINNKQLRLCHVLRNKLLELGYTNIEYIGRNDSIIFYDHKYRVSDAYTKAIDLESVFGYINKNKELENKQIVLIGHSEGGDINSIVGSKNNPNVVAMVQLASPAQHGKEIAKYQREQNLLEIMLLLTRHGHQGNMDMTTNKISSLDSYHKADIDGAKQFLKENIEPVENFIYQFDNNDSIYFQIDLYLRNRWEREDEKTKEFWSNNYERYYHFFAGNITPQQITVRTFKPENYYPLIKCSVLAVQGTDDKLVNCYPNIESMKQLLSKGGNHKFETMILKDYNHDLIKRDMGTNQNIIEEWVIEEIVKWIE